MVQSLHKTLTSGAGPPPIQPPGNVVGGGVGAVALENPLVS